jgi:hypothetical protein
MGGLGQEVVAGGGREACDDPHKLPWQVRQVGLAEDALVPPASLGDLGQGASMGLSILGPYPS